jgi:hypothetical protein
MSDRTVPEVAQLEAQVQQRLNGRACNVRLALRDNGLVLRGCARSYYAKQLAQEAVMKTTVLPILANEIEVAPNADGLGGEGAATAGQTQGLRGGHADGEV